VRGLLLSQRKACTMKQHNTMEVPACCYLRFKMYMHNMDTSLQAVGCTVATRIQLISLQLSATAKSDSSVTQPT